MTDSPEGRLIHDQPHFDICLHLHLYPDIRNLLVAGLSETFQYLCGTEDSPVPTGMVLRVNGCLHYLVKNGFLFFPFLPCFFYVSLSLSGEGGRPAFTSPGFIF